MMYAPRGFALLISIVLTSVILALGTAMLDIAYKQVLLASSAKNSQYAFYNADSALECALYWDQKTNAFDYTAPRPASSMTCNSLSISSSYSSIITGGARVTQFNVTCLSGTGTSGYVKVYKQPTGTTNIYANGYSSCDSADPVRVERGVKINY